LTWTYWICKLCGEIESNDHIICQCAVAQVCWYIIKDVLEWHIQTTHVEDLYEKIARWVKQIQYTICFYFWLYVAWSVWLIRNDLIFKDIVVSSLNIGVFCVLILRSSPNLVSPSSGWQIPIHPCILHIALNHPTFAALNFEISRLNVHTPPFCSSFALTFEISQPNAHTPLFCSSFEHRRTQPTSCEHHRQLRVSSMAFLLKDCCGLGPCATPRFESSWSNVLSTYTTDSSTQPN
jgi:hypothetical protein